jgi:hypothetical protein
VTFQATTTTIHGVRRLKEIRHITEQVPLLGQQVFLLIGL